MTIENTERALRIMREIVELPLYAWPYGVNIASVGEGNTQTIMLAFNSTHVLPDTEAA